MVVAFRESLLTQTRMAGLSLSQPEIDSFETHYRILQKWNLRMNLTGLKDQETIVKRHFLEPIAVSDLIGDDGRLVDLGSGNGFPAIPLKVLHPGLDLVLIESSEKKSAFLWTVLRELELKRASVVTRRVRDIEDLSDLLPCRYLTLRAIRTGHLLAGEGVKILNADGRALLFLAPGQVETLRHHPPPGLRLSGTRPLPSGPRFVLAILEPVAA